MSVLSPYVRPVAGDASAFEMQLHVAGMHCARCIWAIESALKQQSDILEARVNLSTARLSVSWRGDAARADALASLVESLGYKITPVADAPKITASEDAFLLRCMAVSGFAMGNIMMISVALWSSDTELMGMATRELMHWISAAIALPAIAYAGRPFFRSAFAVLKHGRTNMDVPISLALTLAFGMSVFETLRSSEHVYFDSAVMLMFFLLIGRWLDARARGKARQHASDLLELLQGTASVLQADGSLQTVLISQLMAGDVVRIAAGEKIPTDAVLIEGSSEIDTALVTGESAPRSAEVGDTLYGGTLNLTTPITCRVLQASDDSLLADIIRLMEKAEQGRASYVRLADKAARLYTPVVHTLSAAAFIYWYGFGGMAWQDAMMISVTTLIITCPCALALAVPVVQVLAVEWLMKRGILVKSGDALERLTDADMVVLDKTGTLTLGAPSADLSALSIAHQALAASLADYSKHPLSRAVSSAYGGARLTLQDVREIAAQGLEGRMQSGDIVFLGKDEASEALQSTVSLRINSEAVGIITFVDALRPHAAQTLDVLHQLGLQTQLLSGDRAALVAAIATPLGFDAAQGDMLPDAKWRAIEALQAQGKRVLMVGDGLNDAPALAKAHVSMSPASGMDITQNTADIVFQGQSLLAVADSIRLARFSTKLVKHNFALSVGYNLLAIPLALVGLVTPMVAAIAMSASSLVVIANSFRLRRFESTTPLPEN